MTMGPAPMIMIDLMSVLFGMVGPPGFGMWQQGARQAAPKLSCVIGMETLGARPESAPLAGNSALDAVPHPPKGKTERHDSYRAQQRVHEKAVDRVGKLPKDKGANRQKDDRKKRQAS